MTSSGSYSPTAPSYPPHCDDAGRYRHALREELGAMTRSWVHFDKSPFPHIVVPGEAAKNRVPRTIPMTKRVQALLHEIMENGLIFDVRTDTNDNGGGKVSEYRCPARHRIVPYTSIRKSLSSAGHRAGLGHVRPHDLRHTFVTRMLDLSVPIEQVNYLAGHKSMAMTKRTKIDMVRLSRR